MYLIKIGILILAFVTMLILGTLVVLLQKLKAPGFKNMKRLHVSMFKYFSDWTEYHRFSDIVALVMFLVAVCPISLAVLIANLVKAVLNIVTALCKKAVKAYKSQKSRMAEVKYNEKRTVYHRSV